MEKLAETVKPREPLLPPLNLPSIPVRRIPLLKTNLTFPADNIKRKDGGDIDQITGATISPRAVVEAVRTALEVFSEVELFEDEALSASPEAVAPYGEQRAGDEPVE